MSDLRVWAPRAERVEVEAAGQRLPMQRGDRGWWWIEERVLPRTSEGHVDYRFVLDGADPLPDPRSPWQPEGVHGPSRRVDHAAFPWTDAGFQAPPLAAAVIYELHVGTFSPEGTFEGAIGKLDELVELGVTHAQLMPVNQFSGSRGWGYDGVDLFAPHHAYGGPDGLKRLVNACHERGLCVLLDVVYNHLGPEGNYLEPYAPYFTEKYHTPWGKAVNLDGPGSDEVRRFFCDNALMWLRDYHVDGLRLDAVHALLDTTARHLLEQLSEEVDALGARLGRHLVLIAETNQNAPRIVRSREAGGYGIHAQWCDDLHHGLHTVLTGELTSYYADFGRMHHLAKALRQAYVHDGNYSQYRGRTHGLPPTGLPGHRFLGYTQTHDQVGNRAQGERLGHLVPANRLKAAAALVFGAPFVPMLFQGEEWDASTPFQYFTDHQDQALGQAVSEGRRREFADFGWDPDEVPDPQARETFQASKLRWEERAEPKHKDVLAWYQALIRLRRERPDLRDGDLSKVRVRFDEDARWLVLERQQTAVAVNLGSHRLPLPLTLRPAPGQPGLKVLLSSHQDVGLDGDTAVIVPPDGTVIVG